MRRENGEQRQHDRLPAGGLSARVRIGEAAPVDCRVIDISRGGLAVAYDGTAERGLPFEAVIGSNGAVLRGEVVRCETGVIGVALRQDAETAAGVGRVIADLTTPALAA
jgi:hypothetical protein